MATPGRGGGEGLETDEFGGRDLPYSWLVFRDFWPFRGFFLRVFLGKCRPLTHTVDGSEIRLTARDV